MTGTRRRRDAPGADGSRPGRAEAGGEGQRGAPRLAAAAAARAVRVAGPDADAPTLKAGSEALGLALSDAQLDQMERYLDLLQRWGRTYNLTAILERSAMRVQHVLDSLTLVPHLPAVSPSSAPVLLDVGSGAGLPGVVVAIARPDWRVVCVDAVAKKTGFIQQVAAELRLPHLLAVHARVEQLHALPAWQRAAPRGAAVVTSRAFASLTDFFEGTAGLLAPGGQWLALKGQVPQAEIDAWQQAGSGPFLGESALEVLSLQVPGLAAQRCLVRRRST